MTVVWAYDKSAQGLWTGPMTGVDRAYGRAHDRGPTGPISTLEQGRTGPATGPMIGVDRAWVTGPVTGADRV